MPNAIPKEGTVDLGVWESTKNVFEGGKMEAVGGEESYQGEFRMGCVS